MRLRLLGGVSVIVLLKSLKIACGALAMLLDVEGIGLYQRLSASRKSDHRYVSARLRMARRRLRVQHPLCGVFVRPTCIEIGFTDLAIREEN